MKKLLRTLLGIKETNPQIDEAKRMVEKAQLDAYTKKKIEYAAILGEEKAKFEYEQAKKRMEPQEKKEGWFVKMLKEGN